MLPCLPVSATGNVKLDKAHFPDSNFLKIVSDNADKNKDGYLSDSEIKNMVHLSVMKGENVSDLTGVEYLTSLLDIYLESADLKKLDVSKNKKINMLSVRADVSTVDIKNNTELENLWIESSKLETLDVSKNKKLKDILLTGGDGYCQIKSIDLSSNPDLESITIHGNSLESLDVSKNHKLRKIYLFNSLENGYTLKTVNLGTSKTLKEVDLGVNAVESVDIGKCPNLEAFTIRSSKLSSLDLSKNKKLKSLDLVMCSALKEIDISRNPKIEVLSFDTGIIDRLTVACGQKFESGNIADTGNRSKYSSSDKSVFTINTKTVDKDTYKTVFEAKKAGTGILTEKINSLTETSSEIKVLYKDVTDKDDFWYEPTYYLSDKDIVKGYADQTEFRPANECTRAQMVTFLWRLNGSPAPKAKTTEFKDVKKGAYYYKAVIWAVEQGITTGMSKEMFAPEGVCTRAQTVAFLWRMAGKPEPKSGKCKFSDIKSSDYFYKATIWASENKIVAGYSDGTFQPSGKCLRRQMVTFLYKYSLNAGGKK